MLIDYLFCHSKELKKTMPILHHLLPIFPLNKGKCSHGYTVIKASDLKVKKS